MGDDKDDKNYHSICEKHINDLKSEIEQLKTENKLKDDIENELNKLKLLDSQNKETINKINMKKEQQKSEYESKIVKLENKIDELFNSKNESSKNYIELNYEVKIKENSINNLSEEITNKNNSIKDFQNR